MVLDARQKISRTIHYDHSRLLRSFRRSVHLRLGNRRLRARPSPSRMTGTEPHSVVPDRSCMELSKRKTDLRKVTAPLPGPVLVGQLRYSGVRGGCCAKFVGQDLFESSLLNASTASDTQHTDTHGWKVDGKHDSMSARKACQHMSAVNQRWM